MSRAHTNRSCGTHERGTPVAELKYSPAERAVLAVARAYFNSFACPATQGWIGGISEALHAFGEERGPEVAVAVLSVVQCMRRARSSVFRFNSPDCPRCALFVTGHEQMLMAAARAAARGRLDAAGAHATLLCEGSDVRKFLKSLETLADKAFPPTDAKPDDRWTSSEFRSPAYKAGI
ncbi:MAG: hypothetical protein AAGG09_09840 [Pseudomonadota bacterium]